MHDIEGIKVEYLPFLYPKWVYMPNGSLINKILYKASIPVLKLIDRGNYYDRSIFWKDQIQKKISEYIDKKNVDTVIVSSGPFRLSYYVAQMKISYPKVKFIIDYRDLWTEDVEITSFSSLPQKRKLLEKRWEKKTVHLADNIITVADKMTLYFDSLTIKNKTLTIPNGFDEEDFNQLNLNNKNGTNDKIKFVFTGTLYKNLSYILIPFFSSLAKLKSEEPHVFSKIEFNFLGTFPIEYRQIIDTYDIEECINIHEKVPLNEVYDKINEADFCLLFLNNVYNFSLSTKFCEYISQKKKIIIMANKGASVDFILQNNLGYWIDPNNTLSCIKQIIDKYNNKEHLNWNSNFNIDEFSVKYLSKKIVACIEDRNFVEDSILLKDKNLLITFDYELFLGKESGTVENCIIKPTNLVLNVLKRHHIKSTIFFIDTSYLIYLQKQTHAACQNDLINIKNQLIDILKQGHYIFPHIHPHWIDAEYNEVKNIWYLNKLEKYRFHNISNEEQIYLFENSIKLIKEIQALANVSYDIDSYRAGGWCLQPFSTFKPFFKEYGIKYDFSVLRNSRHQSNIIYYDFTKIPQKQIYSFSKEIDQNIVGGEFKEFTITSIKINKQTKILNRYLLKYLQIRKNINFGDGFSVKNNILTEELKEKKNYTEVMASIELLTRLNRKHFLNYMKENDYFHFISHPKMLSNHNIKQFDKIINKINTKYNLITDYKKMIF